MRRAALGLAGFIALAGCGVESAGPDARIAVGMGALDLPGVEQVRYGLTVRNESGEVVWTREIDADGYGDGVGAVAYVGPCDAGDDPSGDGQALHRVQLVVLEVIAGGGALAPGIDFDNPAPAGAPLERTAACAANADVPVQFDLTLARRATQGFFDVAVSFEDVFCSAKLDCIDGEGDPLELLHRPGGGRGRTVVLGFACTGGPGSDSWLYAGPVVLECGTAGAVTLPPVEPAGQHGAVAPWVFEHAVYFGAEQLAAGAVSYGKVYWNVALGLDEAALPAAQACTLGWHGTASSARFPLGAAPAGTTWPQVDWSVEVKAAGSAALTCGRHPLYGAGSGVAVHYAADVVWPYEMHGDAPGGGAAAFARASGANATAPAWVSGADLGALAYGASLDVTLAASDADPATTLSFSSADLPAWLSLDAATGRLTGGTTDEAELGTVSFTVSVSDGVHTTSRTFTLGARFAPHCEAIRHAQPALSGLSLHTLDPAGSGASPLDALCDMSTFGGGWTLVVAQFESNPRAWDEGRQADYDPSLATARGFALTGADLPGHDQIAWGRVEALAGGGWDAAMIDYAARSYSPSADYAEVAVQGLATPRTFHLDRHVASHHSNHNPEHLPAATDANWDDTLTLDQAGGRAFTWSFSPYHSIASYRGFGYEGAGFRSTAESFGWALWVRPGAAHPSAPAALPTSCLAAKLGDASLSGVMLLTVQGAGGSPLQVMCDMSQWGGGWTLVAAQHEEFPATNWAQGRVLATYAPSLTVNARQSFALTGLDLPAHTQTAFGRTEATTPGAWTTAWVDHVNYVYTTGNIARTALTSPSSGLGYHLHRNTSLYYGSHDPEGNTGNTSDWNNTLTFDRTGSAAYSWAFSPNHTTSSYRGYAFSGSQLWTTPQTYFWTVWVR